MNHCRPAENERLKLGHRLLSWDIPERMIFRMHRERITVSARREVLQAAETQVKRGNARSVSAWVDAAMEQKAKLEDLATLLAEMKSDSGPVSREEERWARRVIGL